MSTHIEMGINPEDEAAAAYYHQELHDENPEGRDTAVDAWYHRKDKLAEYDLAELRAVDQELSEMPEVREYGHQRVRIEKIENMCEAAQDYVPEEMLKKFAPMETLYADLVSQLRTQIDRYTETLRKFHTSEVSRFHMDTDRYQSVMKSVDRQRRSAHEVLLDDFHALSRFLTQRIPKTGGSGFNQSGWEAYLKQTWFTIDQLKDRDYLAEWSVKTDIVEKARTLQAAISARLEKKSAETD